MTPATPSDLPAGPQADRQAEAPSVADLVAEAVLAVPGVHGLHGGAAGEIATYLPGRRVAGVRVRDDRCEVHLVLAYGTSLLEAADRAREAAARHVDTPVDVTVEDVVRV